MAKECFPFFHDWHVHKRSCVYDIKGDMGLPRHGGDDLFFICKKVCLKCRKVVDEITPAIERLKIEAKEYKIEQKRIEKICNEVFGEDK